MYLGIYIYIYILDSHMAPYGACEVAQSKVRSSFVISKERNVLSILFRVPVRSRKVKFEAKVV